MLTRAAHLLRHASRRTMTTSATGLALPHSDLSYRALLRNLKLLKGMRSNDDFRAVITGYNADQIAAHVCALEPAVKLEVAGDSKDADVGYLKKLNGARIDSVIVSQPYHCMHDPSQLADVYACLHPEDGTLGFLWTRAPGNESWVQAYARGVSQAPAQLTGSGTTSHGGAGSSSQAGQRMPTLPVGKTPMEWFDDYMQLEQCNFRPIKHRKFVEKLKGQAKDLAPLLKYIHDVRPVSRTADEAGLAAVMELPEAKQGEQVTLSLDLHAFHTQVIPKLIPGSAPK